MTPGSITASGAIAITGGYIASGRVIVTPEQAEAAEAHGWEIVGPQGDKVLIAKGETEMPAVRT